MNDYGSGSDEVSVSALIAFFNSLGKKRKVEVVSRSKECKLLDPTTDIFTVGVSNPLYKIMLDEMKRKSKMRGDGPHRGISDMRNSRVDRKSAPLIVYTEVVNNVLLGFAICFPNKSAVTIRYFYFYDGCYPSNDTIEKIFDRFPSTIDITRFDVFKVDGNISQCFYPDTTIFGVDSLIHENSKYLDECAEGNYKSFIATQTSEPLSVAESSYAQTYNIYGANYYTNDQVWSDFNFKNTISFLTADSFFDGRRMCFAVFDELGRAADVHIIYCMGVASRINSVIENGVLIPQFVYGTARAEDVDNMIKCMFAAPDVIEFLTFFCQTPSTFKNICAPVISTLKTLDSRCSLPSTVRAELSDIRPERDAYSPFDVFTLRPWTKLKKDFLAAHVRNLARLPGSTGREWGREKHLHSF